MAVAITQDTVGRLAMDETNSSTICPSHGMEAFPLHKTRVRYTD